MADILTNYSQEEYTNGFKNLLPEGPAWPKDEDALLSGLCEAIGMTLRDMDEVSCDTIDQVFPGTTTDLLSVWQETVGLTASSSETTEQQRQQVIAKLVATGSISNSYYINMAKQLGYDLTIIEYGGIISGIYRCGDSSGTSNDYSYEFDVTFKVTGSTDLTILKTAFDAILPEYISVYWLTD